MEERPLGATGLSVSALGYGSGSVGGLFVRGTADEQRRTLAQALDAGITYVDTAPQYGDGRSEENVGRVLRELGAHDRVVLGTKVRLAEADLRDPTEAIARSLEASLRRLGRSQVDLLQVHNPIADAPGAGQVAPSDLLDGIGEGLRRVRERGLARHVGFTGLGETAAVRNVVAAGSLETVQAYFNAVNPSAGFAGASGGAQDFDGLIDEAAAAGLGVIAIRVLAAGALTASAERHANAGDPSHPLIDGGDYGRDLARADALVALAAESGLDGPVELALRFTLAKAGVSTVLVGFSDAAQLDGALRWTARGPLPAELVERVAVLAR